MSVFSLSATHALPVRDVRVDRALEEVSFELASGTAVHMSLRLSTESPFEALVAFLESHDARRVRSIDLTVEHRLYWVPR